MKKISNFFPLLILSALSLSACTFLDFLPSGDSGSSTSITSTTSSNTSKSDSSKDTSGSSSSTKEEYVEATLNDPNATYSEANKRYSITLEAGNRYYIAFNTRTNTEFRKVYSTTSPYLTVSEQGIITASREIAEEKRGDIKVDFVSEKTNETLNTITIRVTITPKEVPADTFTVTCTETGASISDNSVVNMYVDDTYNFNVKYNDLVVTNALSSDSDKVSISNNKVTALSKGEATVKAKYSNKEINFKVNVQNKTLTKIYAPNEGNDLLIHNNKLYITGKVLAQYDHGEDKELTFTDGLTYVISDNDAATKKVVLSYTEDNVTKSVTYNVKFFVSEQYVGDDTAFNFLDYGMKSIYGELKYLPNEGNIKFLVIPVWFTNSGDFFKESHKTQILEDIRAKVLEEKTDDNYWSVKSYYETESKGKVHIDATISDFYTSGTSLVNYTDTGDSSLTYKLVNDATNWYFSNNPTDSINNYDSDGDGKVDGVICYYAGNYYGAKNATMRSTAYAFYDNEGRVYNTGCFCPIGGIYGFGREISTSWQLNTDDLSSILPPEFVRGANTVIHEVGHQFGAIDLYEYAAKNEEKHYPCGAFSMQDNDSGSHDPFQTNLFGWSKPDIYASKDYNVGDKITISIDDFQGSGNNILLTKDWNEYNSLFDEYLLLELYAPIGLNAYDANRLGFDQAGIRVWHANSIMAHASATDEDSPDLVNTRTNSFKYSTYDRNDEYDLLHLVRNNEEVGIDATTKAGNDDLFKTNDSFSMAKYSKQFVKGNRLDNGEKLGWEFNVDGIYFDKANNKYTGVITLTRVDNTRTQFTSSSTMTNSVTQPSGNTNEIGQAIFNNENILMNYAFNDSSVYTGTTTLSTHGIELYGDTNGNGGSLEISIKDKDGYNCYINSIKLVFCVLTSGTLKVTANGNDLEFTRFTGPLCAEGATDGEGNPMNDSGRFYQVNAKKVKIQNAFTGTINHYSDITIVSMEIEYTIEPNN